MKKLLFSSLIGLALISFSACTNNNNAEAEAKCNAGKCQTDKAKSSKCGGDKKAASKCGK